MGLHTKKIFKPNWNIPRNFHGVWFCDSDELNEILNFRTEDNKVFWRRMARKNFYIKLAKIVPSALISKLVVQRLFKNTNAPMYWIKHGKSGRIKAFYGSRENFDRIGTDWKKFPLLNEGRTENGEIDFSALKDIKNAIPRLKTTGKETRQ